MWLEVAGCKGIWVPTFSLSEKSALSPVSPSSDLIGVFEFEGPGYDTPDRRFDPLWTLI